MSRPFLSRAAEFLSKCLVTLPLMLVALACEVHYFDHRHKRAWLGMGGPVEWFGWSAMLGTLFGVWGRGHALWGSYWRWRFAALGFLGAATLLPMAAVYFGR